MKKITVFLAVIIIVLTMASCGEPSKTSETSTELSVSSETNGTHQDEKKTPNTSEQILTYTYKVPGKNIYIDVPNYQEIEKGYTELFILNGERYVALTYNLDSTAESAMDANEVTFSVFKDNIQNYSYVDSMNISESSNETINGNDVYRFSGTLKCALDYTDHTKSYDAYAVGYSFVMDGVPCSVIGSVINQEQKDTDIKEITEIVDAMIDTLRSEK